MERADPQGRVDALYRQFGPAIFRRCLKLLRDPAEAARGGVPLVLFYYSGHAGAELNRSRSALVLGPGAGRTYLVSRDRTQEVVAEISSAEWPLRVALPAGKYRVERLLPAPRLSGALELPQDQVVDLLDAALRLTSDSQDETAR